MKPVKMWALVYKTDGITTSFAWNEESIWDDAEQQQMRNRDEIKAAGYHAVRVTVTPC